MFLYLTYVFSESVSKNTSDPKSRKVSAEIYIREGMPGRGGLPSDKVSRP